MRSLAAKSRQLVARMTPMAWGQAQWVSQISNLLQRRELTIWEKLSLLASSLLIRKTCLPTSQSKTNQVRLKMLLKNSLSAQQHLRNFLSKPDSKSKGRVKRVAVCAARSLLWPTELRQPELSPNGPARKTTKTCSQSTVAKSHYDQVKSLTKSKPDSSLKKVPLNHNSSARLI